MRMISDMIEQDARRAVQIKLRRLVRRKPAMILRLVVQHHRRAFADAV